MNKLGNSASRYNLIVVEIFRRHHNPSDDRFIFQRSEIDEIADALTVARVLNVGDLLYTFRFRQPLPISISSTAPEGYEWIIEAAGRGTYEFRCVTVCRIVPSPNLIKIKIPEATPEIVSRYALGDEQALLAKVRYNRLIDIFLGITSFSLQSHLRTTVKRMGQIEIDELYVGIDRSGAHYVVPVQAKGGFDQIGVVQTRQDIAFCLERYPDLVCRPVAAQFMVDNVIALFELALEGDNLAVVREKQFRLVPSSDLSSTDLKLYRQQSSGD